MQNHNIKDKVSFSLFSLVQTTQFYLTFLTTKQNLGSRMYLWSFKCLHFTYPFTELLYGIVQILGSHRSGSCSFRLAEFLNYTTQTRIIKCFCSCALWIHGLLMHCKKLFGEICIYFFFKFGTYGRILTILYC